MIDFRMWIKFLRAEILGKAALKTIDSHQQLPRRIALKLYLHVIKNMNGHIKDFDTVFSAKQSRIVPEGCTIGIISKNLKAHKDKGQQELKRALLTMIYGLFPKTPRMKLCRRAGKHTVIFAKTLILIASKTIPKNNFKHEGKPHPRKYVIVTFNTFLPEKVVC